MFRLALEAADTPDVGDVVGNDGREDGPEPCSEVHYSRPLPFLVLSPDHPRTHGLRV